MAQRLQDKQSNDVILLSVRRIRYTNDGDVLRSLIVMTNNPSSE